MNDIKQIVVQEKHLQEAAQKGMDEFVDVFVQVITNSINGQLTAENMARLNANQLTLIAYHTLRDEVMNGGFVQLIHNGYGGFIFLNPFAKAINEWGIDELARLVNKCRKLYFKYHEEIEAECSDDEFMALFEQYAEFDDFDDKFIENEEEWTAKVAYYIDEHIDEFAVIEK